MSADCTQQIFSSGLHSLTCALYGVGDGSDERGVGDDVGSDADVSTGTASSFKGKPQMRNFVNASKQLSL